MKVESYGERLN